MGMNYSTDPVGEILKISTKGRYALRMLLDLAEHKNNGFVPLKEIAVRQDISKQYLEQIVALLNTANLLKANRGNQGGYALTREPSEYTVGEILRITEGSLKPVACMENAPNECENADYCKTLPMWHGLYKVICDYVDSVTLQNLIDDYNERADCYVI